jgi:hypothetical protein
VPCRGELLLAADGLQRRLEFGALELDYLAALRALEVLVVRVAVVVLVAHARPDLQAAQQPGIDQLRQRAVDRGAADLEAGLLHRVDEVIGVEMVVLAEDVADHVALLVRVPLWPRSAGEVLAELLFGAL